MIREIWSDRPSFKRLRFKPGLNIVVAERSHSLSSPEQEQGRTRNGAGKSSLIDLLRFTLGGDVQKGKTIVAAPALKDDTFHLTLDLNNLPITVSRSPNTRSRINIEGDYKNWPIQPDINKKTGEVTLSASSWTDLLGRLMFDLPPQSQIPTGSYLSFSACISYFLRRSRDGGFSHWTVTHKAQSANRAAVPLSFILGLDTDIAIRFLRADDAARAAQELRRAIAQGLLDTTIGSAGQVRGMAVKARRRLERLRRRLDGEEIIAFYGSYEEEAASLDSRIREINDENYADQQLLTDLRQATDSESSPGLPDLKRLYEEAKIVLPDISLRKYEEVQVFHDQVVENRRNHLLAEIDAAEKRIGVRNLERERLVSRHRTILELLESGVSASHYRRLEREMIDAETEAKELETRLELAEKIERARVDVRSQRVEAERALLQDLSERTKIVDDAVGTFIDISSALYEKPATLELRSTPNGLRFVIERPDLPSEGVSQMQIFTFDMTLATIAAHNGHWPGFLVHDSHIFDGVDGRQIGHALQVAAERMKDINGQYIVTMNSDDLEKAEVESGIAFSEHVAVPVLNDTDSGGLFGFRFNYDMSDAALEDTGSSSS